MILIKDGIPLVDGVDYRFGYDATNSLIRLTPIAGVWPSDAVYEVRFTKPGQTVVPFGSVNDLIDGQTYAIVYDNTPSGFLPFEIDLGVILGSPHQCQWKRPWSVGCRSVRVDPRDQIALFEFDDNALSRTGAIPISHLSTDTPAIVLTKSKRRFARRD